MTAQDVPASAAGRLRGVLSFIWLDGMFFRARFQKSTAVCTTTSVWDGEDAAKYANDISVPNLLFSSFVLFDSPK
ncbi:hypothetical protein CEXT_544241 [Caerostris extrusa]|uniref:Uncharacterized protein n=1 Tax=Caerostris extrusa TaxID=172846 RepID=A0AAV4Q994_CAEEX|nr:hypothetical protein CEXT_544241 [Caerostris extrusa]